MENDRSLPLYANTSGETQITSKKLSPTLCSSDTPQKPLFDTLLTYIEKKALPKSIPQASYLTPQIEPLNLRPYASNFTNAFLKKSEPRQRPLAFHKIFNVVYNRLIVIANILLGRCKLLQKGNRANLEISQVENKTATRCL